MFILPNWSDIDITDSIDLLMDLLSDLWDWSGSCGIYCFGAYFPWRNILIAGLVFGKFVSVIVGKFNSEADAAINYADDYYNGRVNRE